MWKRVLAGASLLMLVALFGVLALRYGAQSVAAISDGRAVTLDTLDPQPVVAENGFSVEVIVDGRSVSEYAARGRRYVEALENAEYELRIHNPLGVRVAVALAVDGLNTIDARHTSAWDAHKWVIEPYGTIHIQGWQMSSQNARRFYFTTERDSYGAKLGQTANLGVISAVFFRERKPITIMPVTPRPGAKEDRIRGDSSTQGADNSAQSPRPSENRGAEKSRTDSFPGPDDNSAATGIGRSVRNDVTWINMDLDSRPAGEVTIRYEYRAALVRLGIIPRDFPRPDVLNRRERAQGFEPKYCPQP